MSFFNEGMTQRFFLSILGICAILLVFSVVFCLAQVQSVQEIFLQHDTAIASSLLTRGISPDTIAVALTNEISSREGDALLVKLGFTHDMLEISIPFVAAFKFEFMTIAFLGVVLFSVIVLCCCSYFLGKREKVYQQAMDTIAEFTKGNFSEHLPRNDEGTLYKLFAAIDNLSIALQSKNETEYRTKEFLKNTISDISHQLKTPLAALSMYNEIILDEPKNTAVVAEFSVKIDASLKRIDQLIQSLLKITRLNASNITFERDFYFISDVINKSIAELTMRATMEGKKIVLNGNMQEKVFCDSVWTSEAIGNIVKNALDHTVDKGRIEIKWECSPAMIRIFIADNGCGIAVQDMHHVFKRFYRSNLSIDKQGFGLGLPLAKAIIEGQGGVLSVQSQENQETCFIISFFTIPLTANKKGVPPDIS